jgi:hypothetical protein
MPSTDHSPRNAGLDGPANVPIMTGISHYEDGVACLPDAVNSVTPPNTEPCFHGTSLTVGDRDATDFSETDSVQTERSTVIDESCSQGNENQELGLEDAQPESTSTRFSDVIGHASVKLRIDEMLLPLALPPALAQSILTGMCPLSAMLTCCMHRYSHKHTVISHIGVRSLPASLLLYGPPGCGKVRICIPTALGNSNHSDSHLFTLSSPIFRRNLREPLPVKRVLHFCLSVQVIFSASSSENQRHLSVPSSRKVSRIIECKQTESRLTDLGSREQHTTTPRKWTAFAPCYFLTK